MGQGGQAVHVPQVPHHGATAPRDLRAEVIGEPDADIADRYRRTPASPASAGCCAAGRWTSCPQLWTVLVGAMSLVGPRPMLVEELPLLADVDHRRHLTKPGLTGLWQISGRKEVDWDERMRLDLYYVEHWSPRWTPSSWPDPQGRAASGHGAY